MDLETNKIDALLVSNFYNILYLTGFSPLSPTEREGWALVTKKKIYLFTDGRYFDHIKNSLLHVTTIEVRLISFQNTLTNQIQEIIRDKNIKIIGFESEDLSYLEYRQLKKRISAKFKPTSNIILKKREFKTKKEIRQIKKSSTYADQCLEDIIKTIKVGQTEKEIASRIENWLKKNNLDIAFSPIVAIDKNSSNIHYASAKGTVKQNSIILIDMGAKYKNYCSDITRMIFTGKPSSEHINIYNHLLQIQITSIENIHNNKKFKDLDLQCRTMFRTYNIPEFAHSLGHGVGLEVHEMPHVSFTSKDLILPGQVITIEPGVYVPGFGMRIEDTIYINEDKNPEILTKFSKEMIILF